MTMRSLAPGGLRLSTQAHLPLCLDEKGCSRTLNPIVTGLFQAGVETIVLQPLEALRIRMQSQRDVRNFVPPKITWSDVFPGMGAHYLKNAFGSICFMSTFSVCQDYYCRLYDKTTVTVLDSLLVGGVSGAFMTTIFQPLDVIRVQQQVHQSGSFWQAVKKIAHSAGYKGFFAGGAFAWPYNVLSTAIQVLLINASRDWKA